MKYIEDCGHIVQGQITATSTAIVRLSCNGELTGTVEEGEASNVERLEAHLESFLQARQSDWKGEREGLQLLNDGNIDSVRDSWRVSGGYTEGHEPYGEGEEGRGEDSPSYLGVHTWIERMIDIEYILDVDDFAHVIRQGWGGTNGEIAMPCRRLIGEAMDEDINRIAEWMAGTYPLIDSIKPDSTEYRFTSYDERDQTSTSNLKELSYRYEIDPYSSYGASSFNI